MYARKSTILIVEDDNNTLHVLRYHLNKAGFDVLSADSVEGALRSIPEAVDLIIASFALPDADGYAFRKQLYLDPSTREIPFLFLVDGGRAHDVAPALRPNYDSSIGKPFDPLHLVSQVQEVLVRRRAYEQFIRYDPLTHLLNRPTAEQEIVADLERLGRYKGSASIAILDVNDFRMLNLEKGQALADLVLTALASILSTNVRAVDLVGRLAGGKFILYLPETSPEGVVALLGRVLAQFESTSQLVSGANVTFSGGISAAPRNSLDFKALNGCALEALERAKELGHGQFVVWHEHPRA